MRTCRWATRISLLRSRFWSKKGVKHTSQIGKFVQVSLLLADVPVQALSQRIEPVGDLVLGANGRHRVDGCRNPQTRRGESEKHKLERKQPNSDEQFELVFFVFWSCVELRSGWKESKVRKWVKQKRERDISDGLLHKPISDIQLLVMSPVEWDPGRVASIGVERHLRQ
jgi:hypothetical protein